MSVKVTLKKSWKNSAGKQYAVGSIMQFDKETTKKLIGEGIAEIYNGDYPPRGKVKTEFFKPK